MFCSRKYDMVTGVRRQSGHCSDSCLEKLRGQGAPGQHGGADLEARSGAHLVIESNICLVHSEGSRPCSYTSVASDVSTNLRITKELLGSMKLRREQRPSEMFGDSRRRGLDFQKRTVHSHPKRNTLKMWTKLLGHH